MLAARPSGTIRFMLMSPPQIQHRLPSQRIKALLIRCLSFPLAHGLPPLLMRAASDA
jgi:hypothetical protein